MPSQVVAFDNLRSLANGSISGTYAAVGTPFSSQVRLICLTNNTDGDMIFTINPLVDQLFIPRGSFKLFDLTSNRGLNNTIFVLQPGTQFYVKQSSAPTTGSVYLEAITGRGD